MDVSDDYEEFDEGLDGDNLEVEVVEEVEEVVEVEVVVILEV